MINNVPNEFNEIRDDWNIVKFEEDFVRRYKIKKWVGDIISRIFFLVFVFTLLILIAFF